MLWVYRGRAKIVVRRRKREREREREKKLRGGQTARERDIKTAIQ